MSLVFYFTKPQRLSEGKGRGTGKSDVRQSPWASIRLPSLPHPQNTTDGSCSYSHSISPFVLHTKLVAQVKIRLTGMPCFSTSTKNITEVWTILPCLKVSAGSYLRPLACFENFPKHSYPAYFLFLKSQFPKCSTRWLFRLISMN